jgi:PAS domain S-box-containing protein
MPKTDAQSEVEQLQARLADAEARLAEAQELIHAIQSGDVDAIVVSGPQGEQVFTLQGAEYAYRALVEAMNESAATLGADGTVLYCNQHLSALLGLPIEQIIGHLAAPLFADEADSFYKLFVNALCGGTAKAAIDLVQAKGTHLSVQVSLRAMKTDGPPAICMVVTDLTESRKSELALRESQHSFATLANLVPQLVWMCTPDGLNSYCNQRWVEYTGLTLKESNGTGWSTPVHPDDLRAASDAWNHSALTHEQYRVEGRLRGADGSYRWFLMRGEPLEDAEGNVIRWFGTSTDIHDMKQAEAELREHREHLEMSVAERTSQLQAANAQLEAEMRERDRAGEALRQSEEKYRSLFNTLLEGFCVIEMIVDAQDRPLDFRFLEVNPSFETQTGMHDAQGKLMRELAPDLEAHWFEILARVALAGVPVRLLNEARELNKWYELSAYRVGGPESRKVAILLNDISEHKRAEDALRESEARFRALFENSLDGVFLTVHDGTVLAANPAACKMFGMTEAELCRAGRQRITDSDDPGQSVAIWDRQRNGRVPKAELNYVRSNGEKFPCEVDSVVLPGDPPRSFVILRDITERRRITRALIESEKLATVGRLASTIAHEINNPLEAIGNALYLAIISPETPPVIKSYLDIASEELERVTHVTRQTLEFHHSNNTAMSIDLRENLDGVLNLYQGRLRTRDIAIERRYSTVQHIYGVNSEIRQIITNLLSNSLDALANDGKLSCRITRSVGRGGLPVVRLTIADNGSGIDPVNRKKIFEPFFTTKEFVGTGLGLWIIKQIVEKHGGTIRVRSKLHKGTVFSIAFPIPGAKAENKSGSAT